MKRYFKSILAFAAVSLVSLSARAADYDIGQIHVDEESQSYSASYIKSGAKAPRWFCLYCTSGSGVVKPAFLNPQPDKDGLLSYGAVEEAVFKFTGVAEGTAKWTVYRTSASGDKVPDCSNPQSTRPYSGDTSNSWQAQDTYTIEVVGGQVVIAEEVAVGEEDVEELTVTSEVSGNWSATVTEGDDVISLMNATGSGTSLTFGITGQKAGEAKVSVSQGGTVKALYNVTVFDDAKVLTACVGDMIELDYNPNQARIWMLDETKGSAVLASKAGQGTSAGTGTSMTFTSYKVTLTAVEEGTKGIWVRNRTTSSGSSWTEVDAFMVKVLPARATQMAEQAVSVDCRGTAASAGTSATWKSSVSPENAASVEFVSPSTSGATAKVTGHEAGNVIVTVGNTNGTLSAGMSGVAYTLAFSFTTKETRAGTARWIAKDAAATLDDVDWVTEWTATSKDSSVATVTPSGASGSKPVVTAVAGGVTEVWVENDDVRYEYEITVTAASASLAVGGSAKVTCTAPSAGDWVVESGNTDIAKVSIAAGASASKDVTITGVGAGKTTVTATCGDCVWTIAVEVEDLPPAQRMAKFLAGKTGNAIVDAETDPDALILKYTTVGDSTLEIPEGYVAMVDYLVVGGGGAGGKSNANNTQASGGAAGNVAHAENTSFAAGEYAIGVGAGGAAQTTNNRQGANGGGSSLTNPSGTALASPQGGTGGAANGSSAGASHAYTSSISGTSVTYATGGERQTSTNRGTNGANPGDGGVGTRSGTSYASGKGADGIVIVRITKFLKVIEVPKAKTGLVFGNDEQTGVEESELYALSGDVTATGAGDYVTMVTPGEVYCWADGSTAAKEVKWSIGHRPVTVTVVSTNKVTGAEEPVYRTSVENAVAGVPFECTWTVWRTNTAEAAGTYDLLVGGEEIQGSYRMIYVGGTLTIVSQVKIPTAVTGLVYNGNEQTGVAESDYYTLTDNTATGAGNYTAIAMLKAESPDWEDGTREEKSIPWSIARAAATVTADSTSKVYGAQEPTYAWTVSGTNGFDGAEIVANSIGRTNECADVGTYDIVPKGDAEQGNYAVTFKPGTLTITRAPIAKPTAQKELAYNGGELTGVVAGDGYTLAGNLATNAGTYTATATLDGNHKWADDSTDAADVNFTIAPAEIAVTADNKTVKLDAPAPEYTYTVTPELFGDDKLEGSLACDYDPNSGTNKVGMVFDILQGTLTNANYTITSFTKGTLTIASLMVTLSPAGRTYDGTAFPSNSIAFAVTDNDGEPVTDFTVTGPESMTDAGTYAFKVTAGGLEGSADFVVSQALVTVTAVSTNKVYGAADPTFTATVDGTIGSDTVSYTVLCEHAENVGEYEITPSGELSQGNYKVEFVPATFTITPKDVTVTANSAAKTYGDDDPDFTATVVGTNGTDGVTYKFTREPGNVATNGAYVIRPVSVNDDYTGNVETQGNYVVTYDWSDTARLTIDRKSVTVTIASTNLVYGDVYPDWESSAGDLPYGDRLDYTLAPLNCEGDASETAYEIAPVSYNTNGNYDVTFVNGKLTVERRPIYVTVVETNKVYGAEDPDFTYVVYSNAERTVELKTLPNGQPVVLNGKLRRTAGEDVKDSPYDVDDLTDCNETNNPNYIFEEMLDGEDKFTITPAKLTVKADDKTILLGEEVLELTATFTGLTNDDAQDVIDYRLYVRDLDAAVGEYTIVAEAGATTNANYDVTYVTGTLTISGGKIIVNGKGYDDLNAAFEELEENGGAATVNEDFSYGGYAFTEGSTLTVDKETGALSVNGMLTLLGDLRVGTVVTATNVVLAADVTVGVTEETTSELAILTFKELGLGGYKLTLTTNGVIRSAKKLEIENVFVEPSKAYEVIETEVSGVWEYTAVLRGFIITFNSNGGSAVEPIVASAGETVKGPESDPTRTGYGFDGWYTNDVEVSFPLTMPMADFTLDAHWTANTYKVAYDSNGGEGASVTNDAAYDAEFEVAACMFTKTGYTFAGWTTNLQSAAEFQPGDSVSNLTAEAGATVTMYATWTGNVYQVVYDPNGGEGTAATSNATYDVEFAIAGNPGFSKTGYTFESWTNAAGDVFAIGAPATNLATSGEVTLYAAWTPNGYTLTYKPGEGTGDDIETNLTYDVKHTVIGKPDDFVKTGYSFAGWADGEGAVVTHQPGNVVVNLTNEQDAVVTWTAVWTGNVYTVTFNPANGEAPFSFSTNCDAMVEAPADPTKTGYTFRYWSTNGVEVVFPIAMPADGLEVAALWNANEYKVEYNPNGGAGEAAMSNATYDVEFAISGDPGFAKTGYSFNSWTNAEGAVFAFGAPATNLAASGEVKLYAAWTPNGYTLTYRAGEGEGDDIVSNLVYDVGYEVADCTFAKTGYSFRNWTNESGVAYLPGQAITNLAVSGNVDFTAVWTANVYTVTFNLAGGTGVCDPIVAFCDAMIDAPAAPTKKGCVFGGWYEGGSEFTFPAAMPAHDVVLTAQWDPLEIGPGVKAYFDSDLDTVVLELDGTGAIDLVALTNKLIQAGVSVDPDDFNAVVKTDEGGFVTPAGWTDATDPDTFDKTLGDALKGGVTSVFVCEDEPPAEIIEKREVEVEPGVIKVVTAVVENDATGVESNAIQVAAAEGLADIAQERNTNVTLRVEATPEADVGKENVLALKSVSISGIDGVESYRADYVSLTVLYGDDQVTELDTVISIFIPWSFNAQCTYRMSRIHNGVAEVIPEGAENAVDGEYVERLSDGFRVHLRKFSDYAIAEIVAKPSPEPKPSLVPELYENVSPETLAADPFVGNTTYNGWTRGADGEITGSLIVKAGKANKNTGVTKLTVTYTPVGGKKRKITIEKSAMPVAGGNPTVCIPGIGTVQFAGDTIVGVDCDVQMGKDLFKDKATKKTAAATVPQGAWTFAVPSAKGYASFSVTVSKKGKAKVKGVMSDGTKVSVSVQGVFGDNGKFAIPVVYAKKTVSVSFVMWINRDKNISCITDSADEGWNGLEPSTAIALADGPHAVSVEDLGIAQAFDVAGKKWTFPKYSKKDPSPNPASVKLTWTQKTGVVKGSFKIEKTKFTVNGVVVDGVVYGSAFKKGVGSHSLVAE